MEGVGQPGIGIICDLGGGYYQYPSANGAHEEKDKALAEVKVLSGFLPICASCKNIRDDKGYWKQIESYISHHSEAQFSHSICPDCAKRLYPELDLDLKNK